MRYWYCELKQLQIILGLEWNWWLAGCTWWRSSWFMVDRSAGPSFHATSVVNSEL